MNIFLILLAAGEGKRLKSKEPKPFILVNNKSLIQHSIDKFKNFKEIKKTIIVYNKKHKKRPKNLNVQNTIKILGGKTRKQSTFLALKTISKYNCSKVLIHDAARPNPSKELIRKIITELKNSHAVVPIIKTSDATKRIEKNTIFKKT